VSEVTNRQELLAALAKHGVSPSSFDVSDEGKNTNEVYVLRRRPSGIVGKPDFWTTFYCERGLEQELRQFASEGEACRYFLQLICDDPITRSA
jgi:hypothetical protein